MKPIKVGLLLHFYQPWWQFSDVLAKIADQCYRPIFRWLAGRRGFAFSANISWSLIELLHQYGHDDVIALMSDAVRHEKVELFGTAAHHPIMPLISAREWLRQIARDRAGKTPFGLPGNTCNGFYLPEYAWNRQLAAPLRAAGFDFTVADDLLFSALHDRVPFDRIPQVDGLSVFLRSRLWGDKIAWGQHDFDRFAAQFVPDTLDWFGGRNGYVVLATDAETFGHHHARHFDWLLKPMIEQWADPATPVEIVPFSRLMQLFGPGSEDMEVPPGSWSTDLKDFLAGNYYPLWKSPRNVYHQALWRLVSIVRPLGGLPEAADDVMKMLASCCWWQVSGRPNFNPGLMMIGARKALEIARGFGSDEARQKASAAFERLARLPGMERY